ncbi:succinylglutamate desuccinylase/aspartoacylase family protein [Exilibacterium tricleocarpae]|uniref:Succinylglutamate desuccinylase/aspartoacylase family protein n=1 Tax=Exilibacterium tricleocarpae TaxID=2591008 RepID=A0A545TNN3_9GAMM|nr:succinylglutamate desuccinylase/aspartoacylase family protein [Exilibacterium tricleocarpae]TQV78798.1 succinylglutamate desuccinylase/aspartoacylase family protein [Exilibacterium tricleocarpae]
MPSKNTPIEIAGVTVRPGEYKTIDLPLAAMYTHNDVQMTVHVICGKQAGPVLFISAAIHGDEINGVDIIRRVLKRRQLKSIKGTLVAIPVVNVHGFLSHSRYLPDGRDLNRTFPGGSKGSLAGRIANTFFREIVKKCTHGIDLHTGARHRSNLPQVRADLSTEAVRTLAHAFGVPVIIDSKIRDGSLRQACSDAGIPILLYEAGEALRFDEICIRAGVRGVVNIMREIGMLPRLKTATAVRKPVVSTNTTWVRAPHSGILRALVPLGAKAEKGSVLGVIADPLGVSEYEVVAQADGIVIGRTYLPLVHEGEALFHLAHYEMKTDKVLGQVEKFQEKLEPETTMVAPQSATDAPIQ